MEYRLGRRIGDGCDKECYAVIGVGHRGLAALRGSRGHLQGQIRMLDRLLDLGVPALRHYGLVRARRGADWPYDGFKDPVLLVDRWDDQGFLAPPQRIRVLPAHIQSLILIRDALARARIYVYDLQFLWRHDGGVCIHDPARIHFRKYVRKSHTEYLNTMIERAQARV